MFLSKGFNKAGIVKTSPIGITVVGPDGTHPPTSGPKRSMGDPALMG